MRRVVEVLVPKKAQEQNDMSIEWDVPTFGVPKKAEGVSIVSNFRKINKLIKRNHWPISIIQDMFDHGNVTLYNKHQKRHEKISSNYLTLGKTLL